MTTRKTTPLYKDHPQGSITASVVGSFMLGRRHLLVVRPGYDAQGRRRQNWTQVVDGDVPIWEFKRTMALPKVLEHFRALWKKSFAGNAALIERSMDAVKASRRKRFRDGMSGMSPAPSLTRDGRGEGIVYTS